VGVASETEALKSWEIESREPLYRDFASPSYLNVDAGLCYGFADADEGGLHSLSRCWVVGPNVWSCCDDPNTILGHCSRHRD
jgi:hypothetical protein